METVKGTTITWTRLSPWQNPGVKNLCYLPLTLTQGWESTTFVWNDSTSLSRSMNVNAVNNTIQAWVMQLKSWSLGMLRVMSSLVSLSSTPSRQSTGLVEKNCPLVFTATTTFRVIEARLFISTLMAFFFLTLPPSTFTIVHLILRGPRGVETCALLFLKWFPLKIMPISWMAAYALCCIDKKCTSILLENTTNAIFFHCSLISSVCIARPLCYLNYHPWGVASFLHKGHIFASVVSKESQPSCVQQPRPDSVRQNRNSVQWLYKCVSSLFERKTTFETPADYKNHVYLFY